MPGAPPCRLQQNPVQDRHFFIGEAGSGAASDKIAAMQAAGVTVCESPADIGQYIQSRRLQDRATLFG